MYRAAACVMMGAVLLSSTKPASAFILTFRDVSDALDTCAGGKTPKTEAVKGEVFAFINSSIAAGSGNLMTLRRNFNLTKGSFGEDDAYEPFTQCATEKATDILKQAGARLVRKIPDLDPEYKNRSFAFFPTLLGQSISAYQLVRVRKDYKTIINIDNITCDATFSVAYVVYPEDSLQPGLEPSVAVQQPVKARFQIELTRASKEVAQAIQETADAIKSAQWITDKASYNAELENFVQTHSDELWLWVNLMSKDKTCSALVSVREERSPHWTSHHTRYEPRPVSWRGLVPRSLMNLRTASSPARPIVHFRNAGCHADINDLPLSPRKHQAWISSLALGGQ
ncbi:hypothetical protein BB934_02895 [Microvirga ossetica]|uniref:Uncharacterized protein n=1 Tax=Microvirga ossetica TaxID=1882682 RepID=A0A1B2EBF2_9HYPH|nr:hypothetical protein [Microvirga ossetica]ANY77298.1 hypothetical protein BB934_02895 [Microvirga ossetica]